MNPFIWDKYSDQPYPIKNKIYKKRKRRENLADFILLFFINLIIFPISLLLMPFFKNKKATFNKIFGMGVSLERGDIQFDLIKELEVEYILFRFPLSDIKNIEKYREFISKFKNQKILLNVLQDRENIEDLKLFEKNITTIFETFSPFILEYQIANAINRTKWGFFSTKEYLKFYQTAQKVRDKKFKNLTLIGSSVIDFEYYYTIRTLFNLFKIKFDKLSSLLYVDRRGAPENSQYLFFDTINKIKLLFTLSKLSTKTNSKIVITETNWPISKTAPYAPTSEKECVSEELYCSYLIRYYLLCISTNMIETIYWHQLISAGYGLIDNREGVRKREAFYAYKNMIYILKDAKFIKFQKNNSLYRVVFEKNNQKIEAIWSNNQEIEFNLDNYTKALNIIGEEIKDKRIIIKNRVIYTFKNM